MKFSDPSADEYSYVTNDGQQVQLAFPPNTLEEIFNKTYSFFD